MRPVPSAGRGFFPLDADLELLPHQRVTPRVAELLVRLGASLPFAEAAEVLDLALGLRLSEATVRRQTYGAGEAGLAVEETELAQIERELPVASHPPERLQVSFDATKVALVGGEWTDVKLATFAELEPSQDAAGQPCLEAVTLSYAARWEPAERFGRTVTLEANRRGVDEARLVVSPNDGAEWIQGLLDRTAPQAVRILDEIHAVEHLGTIGGLVLGADTAAARAWTAQQRQRWQTEPPDGVLAELARCRERGPRPGTRPGPDGLDPAQHLAREVAYFEKRADQIRYAEFRAQLYPIGSGIVESGHRVVIGARLKGAGQHWAPAHLNPLLVLRTTICNDRWTQTWPALWAQRLQAARATRTAARRQRLLRRLVGRLRRLAERPAAPIPPIQPLPAEQPSPVPPPRPKRIVNGRPTADHPWRRSNALFFSRRSA
jgi:hypothetical protein